MQVISSCIHIPVLMCSVHMIYWWSLKEFQEQDHTSTRALPAHGTMIELHQLPRSLMNYIFPSSPNEELFGAPKFALRLFLSPCSSLISVVLHLIFPMAKPGHIKSYWQPQLFPTYQRQLHQLASGLGQLYLRGQTGLPLIRGSASPWFLQ